MNVEYWVVAMLAFGVVMFLIGRHFGQNPAQEQSLEDAVAAEVAKVRGAIVAEASALQHKAATWTSSTSMEVPKVVAVVPPAWALGDSYSSVTALAADIARPDFTRQINIDGAPSYNVGGPSPVDFWTVGGALTQTKPA